MQSAKCTAHRADLILVILRFVQTLSGARGDRPTNRSSAGTINSRRGTVRSGRRGAGAQGRRIVLYTKERGGLLSLGDNSTPNLRILEVRGLILEGSALGQGP